VLFTEELPQLRHLTENYEDSRLLYVFHLYLRRLYFSLTIRCFVYISVCVCVSYYYSCVTITCG
jgi:hypothetical protein